MAVSCNACFISMILEECRAVSHSQLTPARLMLMPSTTSSSTDSISVIMLTAASSQQVHGRGVISNTLSRYVDVVNVAGMVWSLEDTCTHTRTHALELVSTCTRAPTHRILSNSITQGVAVTDTVSLAEPASKAKAAETRIQIQSIQSAALGLLDPWRDVTYSRKRARWNQAATKC